MDDCNGKGLLSKVMVCNQFTAIGSNRCMHLLVLKRYTCLSPFFATHLSTYCIVFSYVVGFILCILSVQKNKTCIFFMRKWGDDTSFFLFHRCVACVRSHLRTPDFFCGVRTKSFFSQNRCGLLFGLFPPVLIFWI